MTPGLNAFAAAASFDPLRPRLVRMAYRMLGSVADAEDVVQDAFLRWFDIDCDLSPLERAAFLLHDVFSVDFEEIAASIDREPATCRQLASRARSHVRAARPRFRVPREHGLEIAAAFLAASRGGDTQPLRSLLAADVTVYADGGGKRPAAIRPIAAHMSKIIQYCFINGLPGFISTSAEPPFAECGFRANLPAAGSAAPAHRIRSWCRPAGARRSAA